MTAHERMVQFLNGFHDRLCAGLESVDGAGQFREDTWTRAEGGGGRSRVMAEGAVFEKAGVNFSEVHGEFTPEFARQMPGDGLAFTATGVSWVLHPRSPHVPTVHGNYRYLTHGSKGWFGGGSDLTPYYPVKEDVVHFHKTLKAACDRHAPLVEYAKLKHACDEYFHLPHRNEARGVGGLFFDYFDGNGDFESAFAFVQDAADSFLPAYLPIVERRKNDPYTAEERAFQEYRRGRYVEFNLIYDRGTIFGLKTNGRTESILMSLPPVVRYVYNYQPPGRRERELTEYWLKPRDWASEE